MIISFAPIPSALVTVSFAASSVWRSRPVLRRGDVQQTSFSPRQFNDTPALSRTLTAALGMPCILYEPVHPAKNTASGGVTLLTSSGHHASLLDLGSPYGLPFFAMLASSFLWTGRGATPYLAIHVLIFSQSATSSIFAWHTSSQLPHPVHLYMASTNSGLSVTFLPSILSILPDPALSSWLR